MANQWTNHPLYLLMIMIICSWVLAPVQADKYERKTYIVYMGARQYSEIPAKDFYLKMIQDVLGSEKSKMASKYLLHTYKSFQGCVATLTKAEAEMISGIKGVVSVFRDSKLEHQTTRSWDFTGFPVDVQRSITESDVVVGVIDTGIWPESESFNDDGFSSPPSKWKGQCQLSNDSFTCNNKIIGARYFRVSSFDLNGFDINSPRDTEGHGTHTASTVAGGVVTAASFLGLGLGTARGGVPSARIAVYKVCWSDGCFSSDILAAFDAAISDGVDILSVSLGSTKIRPYFNDPVAIGAFHAMEKGILTSTSAGNSGPGLETVKNYAPWVLSVGASTIDRKFTTTVQLGNGMIIEGISVNTFDLQSTTFPLIYGGDAQNSSSEFPSRSCRDDSLNSTLVKGKIVVCDALSNGTTPFLAGAAGLVMQGLNSQDVAFSFPLPASYLMVDDASPVVSYARNFTSTPFGTILKSVAINDTNAPAVASFSSKGPNPISPGILKPDLTAPGVDILAAYSPIGTVTAVEGDPRSVPYNIISGTSMSCPHASAVAAYVKSFHPTWSPAAIKSALMTTAFPMSNTVNEEAEFAYGSGHINPLKAIDPGLVYDNEEDDYVKFLCAENFTEIEILIITGKNINCSSFGKTGFSDLNYPSIALPASAGAFDAMFNRTVTNVGLPFSTYNATVTTPEGQALAIKVQPNVLSFNSVGQKLSFTVRISGSIGLRNLMSASLVWDDGQHQVRSPIVVYNLS